MRRRLLSYPLLLALTVVGFAATVHALNSELYSAHGFVRSYLSALERHQVNEALEFAGVAVPASANRDLLTDAALGDIISIQLLSDVATNDQHVVRFSAVLAGEERILEFHVEPTGARFGLFSMWRFAESPVATLSISSPRDDRATANGVTTTAGEHAVLVPAVVTLDHESSYLEASAVTVAVSDVGAHEEGVVDVVARATFDEAANAAVALYLDDCITQKVLMPTGCPMGETVANRVSGEPVWSLEQYPTVELEPGTTAGEWRSAPATGLAHVSVAVTAILDGTVTQLDEDLYFSAVYVVTVGRDDELSVTVDPATLGGFTG